MNAFFSSIEIQRKKFFAWLHYCSQAQANIAFESQRHTWLWNIMQDFKMKEYMQFTITGTAHWKCTLKITCGDLEEWLLPQWYTILAPLKMLRCKKKPFPHLLITDKYALLCAMTVFVIIAQGYILYECFANFFPTEPI